MVVVVDIAEGIEGDTAGGNQDIENKDTEDTEFVGTAAACTEGDTAEGVGVALLVEQFVRNSHETFVL